MFNSQNIIAQESLYEPKLLANLGTLAKKMQAFNVIL